MTTTIDSTPAYKTLPWLFARWPSETLMHWTQTEIDARAVQVRRIAEDNLEVYETARAEHNAAREAFRAAHPRSDLPSALRRAVPRPPDLQGQWKKLINRRAAQLHRREQEAMDRKDRFLAQMAEGQFKAMQTRERAIRTRINALANEHHIRLTERALDRRLEELLIAVGLIETSAEAS